MDKEFLYVLTKEVTADGSFEGGAESILFATHDKAVEYVKNDTIRIVLESNIDLSKEELHDMMERRLQWCDDSVACLYFEKVQYFYSIRKMEIPTYELDEDKAVKFLKYCAKSKDGEFGPTRNMLTDLYNYGLMTRSEYDFLWQDFTNLMMKYCL